MSTAADFADKYERYAETVRADVAEAINPHAPNALTTHELNALGRFLFVLRRHQNNSLTPIEDFIVNIPRHYQIMFDMGVALTPDDLVEYVNHESDGCRYWFDEAVDIARRFRKEYAKLLDEADAKEVA